MSRRRLLLILAGAIIVAGLVVHAAVRSEAGGVAGDVLYAVMAYLLAAALLVRKRPWFAAVVALGVSMAFGADIGLTALIARSRSAAGLAVTPARRGDPGRPGS